MTQLRKFEYLADDSTFDINNRLIGIVGYGVYRGFDVQDKSTSDLVLRLKHTGNGASFVDQTLIFQENIGVLLTKQNVVISETDTIEINIATNAGSGDPRIDTIIIEHTYDEIEGGSPGIYSVINGSPAAIPTAPNLTDPDKQTKIGEIYLPGSCSDLSNVDVEWIRELTPKFANTQELFIEANYSSSDFTIEKKLKNKNFYYLNFSSPDSQYKNIQDIDLTTIQGLTFHLISNQPLQFISNSNIKTVDDQNLIIKPFEEVTITYLGGAYGIAPYIVIAGGDLKRNLVNKVYKTLKFNKSTTTTFESVESYAIELGVDGNIATLNLSDGDDIRYIKSLYDGGNLSGDNNGGVIILNLNIPTGSFILTNKTIIVPSGYKNIKFPWGDSNPTWSTDKNISLILFEDNSEWVCVGMIGDSFNSLELDNEIKSLIINDLTDVTNISPSNNDVLIFDNILGDYINANLFNLIQLNGLDMDKPINIPYSGFYVDAITSNQLRLNEDKQIHNITIPENSTINSIKNSSGNDLPVGYFFMLSLDLTGISQPVTIEFGTSNIKNIYNSSYIPTTQQTSYVVGKEETFIGWFDGSDIWLVANGLLNSNVKKLVDQNIISDWNIVGNDGGETTFLTGWSQAGSGALRDLSYRKNKNFIEIHGQCRGSGTATEDVFILPEDYRPVKSGNACYIIKSVGVNYTLHSAQVRNDGEVQIFDTYTSDIYQVNIRIPID